MLQQVHVFLYQLGRISLEDVTQ